VGGKAANPNIQGQLAYSIELWNGSSYDILYKTITISIGDFAFLFCANLASVAIGNSVSNIGDLAFYGCPDLASVTFTGTIPSSGFGDYPFDGDLLEKYLGAGGSIGTYTRASGSTTWSKS